MQVTDPEFTPEQAKELEQLLYNRYTHLIQQDMEEFKARLREDQQSIDRELQGSKR